MASEPKTEPKPETPQLHLTSFPNLKYPQTYSGALTPLHTSASVPFSWEQEPGKPLPCLTLALPSSHSQHNVIKCLELPPRLLNEGKMTKTPSPTTVLEGPYNSLGRSILGSSSFRFLRKRRKSFDGAMSFSGSAGSSPERALLTTVVVSSGGGKKEKGLFGSWRKKGGSNYKGKSEVHGGSFVFPSYGDDGTASCCDGGDGNEPLKVGRVSRKKSQQLSLSQHAKSHFWVSSSDYSN
ncbi:hypothetical protein RND81_02G132800 [Saponaria officinalis]|uniref:Uncharacterized protein n=1 Tax=Saponaria officinalis TaxID=3572 RepID=A0AAW1MQ91_SAPOF